MHTCHYHGYSITLTRMNMRVHLRVGMSVFIITFIHTLLPVIKVSIMEAKQLQIAMLYEIVRPSFSLASFINYTMRLCTRNCKARVNSTTKFSLCRSQRLHIWLPLLVARSQHTYEFHVRRTWNVFNWNLFAYHLPTHILRSVQRDDIREENSVELSWMLAIVFVPGIY